jgi:hypothetical protein
VIAPNGASGIGSPPMIARGRLARWRSTGRRLGTWLAIAAILIQGMLPLVDAAIHATFGITDVDIAVAAPLDPHAVDAISKQTPAHLVHACPICQFITSLGSFTPPSPARATAPVSAPRFAIWPAAPPALRSAAASAAQPRAPPVLI